MATPERTHPTDAQLTDFSSGKLAATECDEIEKHLAECDTCCQLLKTLPDDSLVALLRQEPPATPGEPGEDPGSRLAATLSPESDRVTAQPGAPFTHGEASDRAALDEVPAGLRDHPRYRIVRLLGRGGMGNVYQAEHRLMRRCVAIKVINPQLFQNTAAVERFQREVQAAAKLAHPNIVAAYDAEQAADTHFLVMEYVQGEDLSALVRQHGRLPVATACDYVRQAALGLEHARQRGMVHRDIKPQNLILTPTGQVKILDFGLAQFASESAEQSTPAQAGTVPGSSDDAVSKPGGLTQAGVVMGTPDYMAPEQARDAHSADIRSDIYSLGCTLYCLLTGRPPFTEGTALAKITAHLGRAPKSVAELCDGLPLGLLSVLQKMMAKNPADRYQTPAEVAGALASFASSGSEPAQAPLPAPATAGPRPSSLPVALAVLVGLAFLAVFAGLIVIVTDQGRIEIQSEVADVEVVVTQGGKAVTVFDRQTGSQVKWLPSGTYDVQVQGNRNDIELSRHGFALSRWGKQVVTLKHKTNAATVEKAAAQDFPRMAIKPTGSAPPLAVAPCDAKQAKSHQAAWATHLGLPIEFENSLGMRFALIPPGEFDMGSTDAEVATLLEKAIATKQEDWYIERLPTEAPKHRVRITKPLYLGLFEVTQAEYQRVVGTNPSHFQGDPTRPVEMVNWDEASAFCRKLGNLPQEQASRAEYRLPTEAEWEYACRAGAITAWYPGDDEGVLKEHAWYNADAGGKTHPVGRKSPNAWGLYDMHGNVWEWCQDWSGDRYYAMSPRDDPTGTLQGSDRVFRGGSCLNGACDGRASVRGMNGPGYRNLARGFRLVMVIPLAGSGAASSLPSGAGVSAGPPLPKTIPPPKPATPPPVASPVPPWTLPAGAPPPAISPFDATKAKEHQAAWAKHLGLPVETTNSIGMKVVLIPPGEFDMGSTVAEVAKLLEQAQATNQPDWYIERLPAEAPKHRIRITKPFWFGVHEVTRGQFRRFADARGYKTEAERDGKGGYGLIDGRWEQDPRFVWNQDLGFEQTDDHPVVNVSWNDVTAFCAWLSEQEGTHAQLPTEAQWEYACRAGTTATWYSGDDEGAVEAHAWFSSNSERKSHPVGQKSPNAWGLYDLHGNVWEWCQDGWGDSYYATSPMDDPPGAPGGSPRVYRGGGWDYDASRGRASYRAWDDPGCRAVHHGFRVARSLPLAGSGGPSPPPRDAREVGYR